MRKLDFGASFAALLCVASLAVLGCVPQGPTDPGDITVQGGDVTVTVGGQGGTGGTTPTNGTCNPPASIGAAVLGTGGIRTADIRVGQTITLDSTIKDANNQIRPDACNLATPVLWRLNPVSGICSLNNETSYTPTLTGVGVGRCEAFSQVGNITSPSPVVVNVRS